MPPERREDVTCFLGQVERLRSMCESALMLAHDAARVTAAEYEEAENKQTVRVDLSSDQIARLVREMELEILFSNTATLKRFCSDGR